MKDGTLKYTPKNANSRIKVTFYSMKHLIKSTNETMTNNDRLGNVTENQQINKPALHSNKTFKKKIMTKKRA